MEAEELKAKQAEQTNKQINTETNKRRNEQHPPENPTNTTPRPKAKAKSGPSPNKNLLPPIPPFPDGGKASGSTDNPESTPPPKGPRGRPAQTQPTTNTVPPPVRKDNTKHPTPKATPKTKPRPNPRHDTDFDCNSISPHLSPPPTPIQPATFLGAATLRTGWAIRARGLLLRGVALRPEL